MTVEGREEQNTNYTVASRKWIAEGADVFVKEFTLELNQEVPWHSHTEVFDVFYCIEGRMQIERRDIFSGGTLPTLLLAIGDSAKVEPGTAHRVSNPHIERCRFVIVQGVGPYDYIPYQLKK